MILDAVQAAEKLNREQAHRAELPIALNTQVYANSQKTKPPYFELQDFCFFRPQEVDSKIPSDVCDAIFEMANQRVLPGWALALAPIEEMEKGRRGNPVTKPRLWMARGVALILPRISGNSVSAGMALIDNELVQQGFITLFDVDSEESHKVLISSTSNACETNINWPLIEN